MPIPAGSSDYGCVTELNPAMSRKLNSQRLAECPRLITGFLDDTQHDWHIPQSGNSHASLPIKSIDLARSGETIESIEQPETWGLDRARVLSKL